MEKGIDAGRRGSSKRAIESGIACEVVLQRSFKTEKTRLRKFLRES